MTSPFPIRRRTSSNADDVLFLDPADDRGEEVLKSMSSDTAMQVLAAIKDEPKPASEIAEAVDSSIQNVRYHLENLESAGLVSAIDVWYSSSGAEMDVYGPTQKAVVVLTGPKDKTIPVREAIASAAVTLLLVGLVSQLIARWTTDPFRAYQSSIAVDPGMLAYLRPDLMFIAGGAFALATTTLLLTARRV